jgi:tetratricopeptide (TPR) repeat protein
LALRMARSPSCIRHRAIRIARCARSSFIVRNAQRGRPRFGDSDFGATRAQIVAGSFILFVPFAIIALLLCLMFDIQGWARVSVVVTFGTLSARACVRVGLAFANAAGQFVARFVAPSGSTTPYEPGFSYQQSLAARGDVAGALESYEAVLRESPHDVEALAQAADLYASHGHHERAIALFRAMRAIPDVSAARDVYASNRLIDLYLGPVNDEGRALVELRRLIEMHPGTDTARRAREALGRLKPV